MKKRGFYALAASCILLSACSSSDDAVIGTGTSNDDAVQQIVLQVASSGDGLSTRAGRHLYSSAALQAIQNVRVLIYDTATGADQNKIVYDSKLDWKNSTQYTTGGHGREMTINLKGDQKLAKGSYKVIAVGYAENSDYTFNPDITNSLQDKTYSEISGTLKSNAVPEEVFAGESELTIGDDQKISNLTQGEEDAKAVTLHRQVAGGFGYFKNVPAKVNGKEAATLRMVMRNENDVVTFKDFNSSFTTTNSNLMYVVNGSRSGSAPTANAKFSDGSDGYVLYSINLKDWFPNGDANDDGLYNYDDYKANSENWTRPTTVHTGVDKGSVFASNFIIPFALEKGKNTMELQLLDEEGNILKSWSVSIPANDVNKESSKGEEDVSALIFNVVRNHMYNLGVKTITPGTKDPDPSNPDPEPTPGPDPDPDPDKPTPGTDEPEDLSKGQNLILKVNDNWEAIHQMELE